MKALVRPLLSVLVALQAQGMTPLLLFAPGAGAPSSSEWMQGWSARLGAVGYVQAFDYPYMEQGRRRPDPLPVLIAAHHAALAAATARHRGPVVLVGKSMGGRIGCHLALKTQPNCLICFGYPLLSSGKVRKVRDEVLKELRTPVLFIQGTRDPLCPLDLLARVRDQMTAPSQLYSVTSGDHSLQVSKTGLAQSGTTPAKVEGGILSVVHEFVARHCTQALGQPVA